jgi:hypothetical protein
MKKKEEMKVEEGNQKEEEEEVLPNGGVHAPDPANWPGLASLLLLISSRTAHPYSTSLP